MIVTNRLGRGVVPSLRHLLGELHHVNITVLLTHARFAVPSTFFRFLYRCVLMLIFRICVRCLSIFTLAQFHFFSKMHVKRTLQGIASFFRFPIAPVFSEPSCIYICLAGVNYVFDKGHVAHNGEHFNPQVFVNKQGQ